MKVYFGVEITFNDLYNDFLIYGVDSDEMDIMYSFCNKGCKSFVNSSIRKKCAVFTANPYRNDRINSDVHIPG